MAKRRTKSEKKRAKLRRPAVVQTSSTPVSENTNSSSTPAKPYVQSQSKSVQDIMGYNLMLVRKDLLKTSIISIGLFAFLIGIFFYMR